MLMIHSIGTSELQVLLYETKIWLYPVKVTHQKLASTSALCIIVLTCLYSIESMPKNPAELVERQRDMEEKVYRIWTVLSAFEGRFHRVCACFLLLFGNQNKECGGE